MKRIETEFHFKKKNKPRAILDGFIGMCIDDASMYRALMYAFGVFFIAILFFPLNFYEQLTVFMLAMLSLFAEAVNTSVEYTVDRVGTTYHPLSMRAKDSAAAASFIVGVSFGIVTFAICFHSITK